MSRRFITIVLVAAGISIFVFLWRGSLATSVLFLMAKRNLAANLMTALPDGLHLALCGAGAPLPDPQRSGPCVAVIAGKSIFVVDAGTGGARNLVRLQVPIGSIAAVLLGLAS